MQKIRKISIGSDSKNQQVFVVGGHQVSADLIITDIIQEQADMLNNIYYIWAEPVDGGESFLWYKSENMPVTIQYYKPEKETK